MQKIIRYRKLIGLTVAISIFFLNFPPSPARAVMISTEYTIDQESEQNSNRKRLKAFLARADVIAQLQAYGISYEEATSRIDSLTDKEIAAMADRMDHHESMAGGYEVSGNGLWLIGLLLFTIFFAIVFYFSRANAEKELSEAESAETKEKEQSSTGEKEEKPE